MRMSADFGGSGGRERKRKWEEEGAPPCPFLRDILDGANSFVERSLMRMRIANGRFQRGTEAVVATADGERLKLDLEILVIFLVKFVLVN